MRREGETADNFAKRQTCGERCCYLTLRGDRLAGRAAAPAAPAILAPINLPPWAFANNVAPRDFGTAPMRPATVVRTQSGVADAG